MNFKSIELASRSSQKGTYKDKRDLVTYEEELF